MNSTNPTNMQYPASFPPPLPLQGQPLPAERFYAGFWIRFLAYIIDALILSAMTMPFTMLFGFNVEEQSGSLIGIIITWMYFALFESSEWQGTPGKKALGLIVTDEAGRRISAIQATKRYAAKILGVLLLGIGGLMIAFTGRKQGLHDKMIGTLVLKVAR